MADGQGGNRKPVHKIRHGLLGVAIWCNTGGKGDWYSTLVERSYFDKQANQWKYSTMLARDDLLKAALLQQKAYEWILWTEDQARERRKAAKANGQPQGQPGRQTGGQPNQPPQGSPPDAGGGDGYYGGGGEDDYPPF